MYHTTCNLKQSRVIVEFAHKISSKIPRSGSRWLNGDLLIQRRISGKLTMRIRSVLICEVANSQMDKPTDNYAG